MHCRSAQELSTLTTTLFVSQRSCWPVLCLSLIAPFGCDAHAVRTIDAAFDRLKCKVKVVPPKVVPRKHSQRAQ